MDKNQQFIIQCNHCPMFITMCLWLMNNRLIHLRAFST